MRYSDENPYLEDAVPCPSCRKTPYERIGECRPIVICGIPLAGAGYGTYLICGGCGARTQAYWQPWQAYLEWNEKIQKEMVGGNNA